MLPDGIVIKCSSICIALLGRNRVKRVIKFPGYKLTLCQKQFQDYVTHPMPGRFEPRCSKTGAFQEIQCHGSSCFCVNREGIELPDTRRSLAMGNPVCSRPGNHNHINLVVSRAALSWTCVQQRMRRILVSVKSISGGSAHNRRLLNCLQVTRWALLYIWWSVFFFSEISLTQCQKQLQEAISLPPDPDRFVPRCKFDGSFEEVQCHSSTGPCWCVDRDGNELSSTATNRTVTCPNIGEIFVRYLCICVPNSSLEQI